MGDDCAHKESGFFDNSSADCWVKDEAVTIQFGADFKAQIVNSLRSIGAADALSGKARNMLARMITT